MTVIRVGVVLLLSLSLAAASSAQTADGYFITIFGSGSHPLRARQTHTFATFTHIEGGQVVSSDTISWMPATLRIRPFALRPETGVNLTQEESLRWAESHGLRTSVWGPFELRPERYESYMARKAELESGEISYRAIGGFTKKSDISNCGQSFSRAGRVGQKYLQPTPFPGEQGTSELVRRMAKHATRPVVEHPELLPVVTDPTAVVPRRPGERIPWFR